MKEEYIRDAFFKVKQDMEDLRYEIKDLKELIKELFDEKNTQKLHEIHENNLSTIRQQNTTNTVNTTANTTVPQEIQGLKHPNLRVSIGNEGASTDRQTNRQTDRHIKKFALTQRINQVEKDPIAHIDKVSKVLDSLDEIKKTLRSQFKKLTSQEMQVFSVLYQLTDEGFIVDYSLLSSKTSLSESSIRDYIQKLIKKGIPVNKTKEDNKKVTLSISPDFKRMASLQTIIQLREI